ncbi:hypothetical protein QJQ45_010786 [Haematococcus lacustris]|nr:hypothetical protein QJQ45_010786 [Haematococcus lacustris]
MDGEQGRGKAVHFESNMDAGLDKSERQRLHMYFTYHREAIEAVDSLQACPSGTAFDSLASKYDAAVGSEETWMGYGLLRSWLLAKAQGDVLEISSGTGRNLPYYAFSSGRVHSLTQTDLSAAMLQQAEDKYFDELRLGARHPDVRIDFRPASAPGPSQSPHSAAGKTSPAPTTMSPPPTPGPDSSDQLQHLPPASPGPSGGSLLNILRVLVPGALEAPSSQAPLSPCAACALQQAHEFDGRDWQMRCREGCCHAGHPLARFPPASFDTVVDTFGLCSHDNPLVVLRQAARVCKPGGKVLLLEHGRSSWGWWNRSLDEGAQRHRSKWGCWWNRDILAIVHQAGLVVEYVSRWHFGTSYIIVASPARVTHRDLAITGETGLLVTVSHIPVTPSTGRSVETEKIDGRTIRRSLNQTGRYTRQPSNNTESQQLMDTHGVGYSSSGLVAQMRENGNVWQQGEVTVKLAKAYGYCWGVERAVRMAYEARNSFPDRNMFITNEIIHNPEVNERLRELDINIVEETEDKGKDYSSIQKGDVVIFPAFGATAQEMKYFRDKGVQMVDTTCPWVAKVWNSVDTYTKKNSTSVIHGKYSHEETVATASFASDYIIVKDLKEAQYLCDYIMFGGSKEEFMAKFKNAVSAGFDPETMLVKVGLANQTTMLKGETEQIGKMLEQTMMRKYGPDKLQEHFIVMDTICDATQERQDALYDITADPKAIDLMIVVGGFNSSNTSHLQEIAEHKGIPSYWVDSAARIDVAGNKVLHKLAYGELKETSGWLPAGPLTIGVTSGASTPDKAVEEVMDKVFKIKDPAFAGITPRECAPMKVPTH